LHLQTMFYPIECFTHYSDMRALFFGDDDPGPNLTTDKYYEFFVESNRDMTGCGFRKAPYNQCARLVAGALQRMKSMKKVLVGMEERTVVRLFGLHSTETGDIPLPQPSPAPSVESLWLTLVRPEYYYFTANEDLHNFYKHKSKQMAINAEIYDEAANYLLKDVYNRDRFIAMLEHMAMWHMLSNEREVASWILWERKSLKVHSVESPDTFEAIKNNAVFQLMVNKYFICDTGELPIPVLNLPDGRHRYGEGVTNHLYFNMHFDLTNKLPSCFLVTACVASSVDVAGSNQQSNEANAEDISKTIKKLKIKKSSCPVCGSTRSKNGDKLSTCSRCNSVAYCCRKHQIWHWKNGHKKQCMKDDPL